MSKNWSKICHFGLWPGGRASTPGLAGATPESPYAPWCTGTCSGCVFPCENLVFQHILGEILVRFLARFLSDFGRGSLGGAPGGPQGVPWGCPGVPWVPWGCPGGALGVPGSFGSIDP